MRTLLLWLLAPSLAHAGGYYYSDSGIVATGRGGAWVAGADTQFAQWYNPAGLIRIDAPTVNVGWSGVQQKVTFTRMGEDGTAFDPVENQAKPFNVPQLGFATPLGSGPAGDFSLAIGLYTPFAPSSLYDEEGPQRYSVKDTTILQGSVGPSVAWRPAFLPQVVLGVGVNWQFLSVYEAVDISINGTEDPKQDVAIELGVQDFVKFGGNVGLLIEPVPQVSVGLSVIPPMRFHGKGRAGIDFTGTAVESVLAETVYEDPDVVASIDLPLVLRSGVAVRPVPKLEIEVAGVYQRWSRVRDIVVTDVAVEIQTNDSPIVDLALPPDSRVVDDDFVIPQNLRDTVSLRIGAEYRVLPELEVRVGGFREGSAVPPEYMDVALVDTAKTQVGAGASVFLLDQRLRFDGAFAMLFFDDAQVRNSKRVQTDAGLFEHTVPTVVGNGDYSSRGWIVGLQAQWAFRKVREPG